MGCPRSAFGFRCGEIRQCRDEPGFALCSKCRCRRLCCVVLARAVLPGGVFRSRRDRALPRCRKDAPRSIGSCSCPHAEDVLLPNPEKYSLAGVRSYCGCPALPLAVLPSRGVLRGYSRTTLSTSSEERVFSQGAQTCEVATRLCRSPFADRIDDLSSALFVEALDAVRFASVPLDAVHQLVFRTCARFPPAISITGIGATESTLRDRQFVSFRMFQS